MASQRSRGQPLITPRLCRSRYQISMVARRSITSKWIYKNLKNPGSLTIHEGILKYFHYIKNEYNIKNEAKHMTGDAEF